MHENKGRASRTHKDTITGYKEIIFGSDTHACMAFLAELRKQQVIDQKIYNQKLIDNAMRKLTWEGLQKNIMIDGDTMIDRRTGEVLGPEVDSTYWKDKFKSDFIVFIGHKITCCKAEGLHILNGTDTLGT